MNRFALGLALGLALGASATAAADAGSQAAVLDRGRVLESQGKHAAAIAAYEEYLVTAPDDPTANAELGLAALGAKDLGRAEAATRRAIAHAPADTDAGTRGAALFNLGLILEAKGAPQEAAVAYADSQRVRPSRAAREKLQKLDPATAAALDPFAPQLLPGPFPDLASACRDWATRHGMSPDDTWGNQGSCTALDVIPIAGKTKLTAPVLELSAFQMIDRSSLDIGIRTAAGWYLVEATGKGSRSPAHCGGTVFHVTQRGVTRRTVPELRLEYTSDGSCFHREHSWDWSEVGWLVVGFGPSGKASAPPPILTAQQENSEDGTGKKAKITDAVLRASWNADGSLDLAGRVLHPLWNARMTITAEELDGEIVLGHHLLRYP